MDWIMIHLYRHDATGQRLQGLGKLKKNVGKVNGKITLVTGSQRDFLAMTMSEVCIKT